MLRPLFEFSFCRVAQPFLFTLSLEELAECGCALFPRPPLKPPLLLNSRQGPQPRQNRLPVLCLRS